MKKSLCILTTLFCLAGTVARAQLPDIVLPGRDTDNKKTPSSRVASVSPPGQPVTPSEAAPVATLLPTGPKPVAETVDPNEAVPSIVHAAVANAEGDKLLDRAIELLAMRQSISAATRNEVHMFGQDLIGMGLYLQTGQGLNSYRRHQLTVPVGDFKTTAVYVSDSKRLWILEQFLDRQRLGQVDLERLKEAIDLNAGAPRPTSVTAWMAVGGLPKLLVTLRENFVDFKTVGTAPASGTELIVLEGRWRGAKLAQLLPAQKAAIEAAKPISMKVWPDYLPDRVRIGIGKNDSFPYLIEYYGPGGTAKAGQGSRSGSGLMASMELVDVQFDKSLPPELFQFDPGALKAEDWTDIYKEKLGLVAPPPPAAAATAAAPTPEKQ